MNQSRLSKVLERLLSNDELIYVDENQYVNELFGIRFMFPMSWNIVGLKKFEESISKQNFAGDYQHYKEALVEFFGEPSLLVTKFELDNDEYDGLISPTINFSIIPKEPDYMEMSLVEYADMIEGEGFFSYHLLDKFRVTNKGELYKRNGFDCIKYETEYLFAHDDLEEPVMIEMTVLNIEYGDYFLDFSFSDCKAQGSDSKIEFNFCEQSIELQE